MPDVQAYRDITTGSFPISGKTGILSRIPETIPIAWPFCGNNRLAVSPVARLTIILSLAFAFPAPIYAQLNDTGITTCANATSNNVPCGYADNDSYGYPRQEAEYGRAAKEAAGQSLGKFGASDVNSKGYDYTKIPYAGGADLAAGAPLGIGANWGCTRDNVTGLIWDMKVTTANGARLNTNTYSWYNTNNLSNGNNSGTQGVALASAAGQCYQSTHCDTEAYIAYINGLGICGETANDWRLPTRLELLSIIDASKQGSGNAAVDATYFPNIVAGRYWTADNLAGNPDEARTVNMSSGSDGTAPKTSLLYIILVRPRP